MLREKIYRLKSKNYKITKITANVVIYDEESPKNSNLLGHNTYFSKEIYKEDKGFSNKYYSQFITIKVPRHRVKEIITKVIINFYIELEKTNNLKPEYKLQDLLERIKKDVIESLNVNYDTETCGVYAYHSEAVVYATKAPLKNQTAIMIYSGTENFYPSIKNKPVPLVKGIIESTKKKLIAKYL